MTRTRNRNPGRGFRLTLLLALFVGTAALSACAVESPAYYRHGPAYGQEGRIDGFITAEGRCPTIRDHETNDVFALTGSVRALRPGDHVALSERSVDGRGCGGAPTLEVLSVDVIWRGEDHRDTWYDASRDGGDLNGFLFANRDRRGWYSERYAYINGGGPGSGPGPDRTGPAGIVRPGPRRSATAAGPGKPAGQPVRRSELSAADAPRDGQSAGRGPRQSRYSRQ